MENQVSNKNNSNAKVTPSGSTGFKINWGTGIVLAFAFFISFILYFIIKVQSNSKYDNDLVYEEYYKRDAKFGDEMIRLQNAKDLPVKPKITNDAAGITIVFPTDFVPAAIKGKITMYRPSNKKFDFDYPISITTSSLTIPKEKLLGGRWNINMEWQYNGKAYLTKETIYMQ
ncbi:FixH family protein [Flavobacterium nackdongense]|uniref:Cytochrome C oxidase Cbb3 n=1 Tax=Flavobacterium nackdongense TaxID=2547394 RepID=A0A4P6Y8R8_9FLAO|nr:FixH family protein [Flavobacterium nackdongense]QBN18258.1 cytochrome C oxidase Cbb3 [Flavobacterium nackdongense]